MSKLISDPIRLVNLGQVPSWQTQAYYHAVAELMSAHSADTIIICQPTTPYLCLGYHQSFNTTFDRAACERLSISVYRRRVGGGGTYLDANQLFYQCIFHHKRAPLFLEDLYATFLAAPVATLRRLGLHSELRAVNEVEAEGYRIAGIGGGRIREASLVVGNFLFDFDYEMMAQVWHAPWEPYRDLAAAALKDRIATLSSLLEDVDMQQVEEILIEEYKASLGRPLESGALTDEELQLGEQIWEYMGSEKYLNLHDDRNVIGAKQGLKIAAGVYVHAMETSISGSYVQASFLVKDDIIQEANLQCDSHPELHQLESGLRGIAFENWQAAINVVV